MDLFDDASLTQPQTLAPVLEAVLFVAGDAVEIGQIAQQLQIEPEDVLQAAEALRQMYSSAPSGLMLLHFGNHLQLCAKEEYYEHIQQVLNPQKKQPLGAAVLETLSVIAYKQPITKPEIEQIRGVQCTYSISVLLQHELIEEAGRLDTLGRPVIYRTTDAFLRHFALGSLQDLPKLELFAQPNAPDADEQEEDTI